MRTLSYDDDSAPSRASVEEASTPQNTLQGEFAEVVKGSFWIVLGSLIVNFGGLVFWLLSGRIAGAEAVGYATGAFSIAMMLSSLGNLGLNYAVLREVPGKGARAYSATLILALMLGLSIATLSILFSGMYGGITAYIPLIYLLTLSSLLAVVSTSALIAAFRARQVFIVNALATTVKVLAGLSLLLLGLGGYGLVAGLFSAQLVALATSTILAFKALGYSPPKLEDLVEALKVGVSNYPQILSTQLVVSAGIVLVAFLTGSPEYTGVFYIALMITLALSIIPGSMASMSLPVMVKSRHYGLADESLRVGGAAVLPLALVVGLASEDILGFVNPEFILGSSTLTVLTLAIIPQAVILNGVSKLNSRRDLGGVLRVGIVRLATLTVLVCFLTPVFGILGAALAYLASTLTPIPLLYNELNLKASLKLLVAQLILLALITPVSKLLGAIATITIGALVPLIIIHLIGVLRIDEAAELLKMVVGLSGYSDDTDSEPD